MSHTSSEPCILVVEDNELIVMLLRDALEDEGYTVRAAYDGTDALELLAENPVRLIITDVMLPYMDGITFTQHVRANSETAGLPVVAITAATPPDSPLFTAVMQKPFSIDELIDLVAELVETPGDSGAP